MPPYCEQHQCFWTEGPFGHYHCKECAKAACIHPNVTWEPIEIEYQHDGTAAVWQNGKCVDCKQSVTLNYLPNR